LTSPIAFLKSVSCAPASALLASTFSAALIARSTAAARTAPIASASGLLDLLLGKRVAARDEFVGLLTSFLGQGRGFTLGDSHDLRGFRFGFLALALVFGEQGLRFLAQTLGFVEFLADVGGALVERLRHHARHLQVNDQGQEDDESDKCEKCCIQCHWIRPPSSRLQPQP
jgi:hypothetical protein